MSAVPIMMMMMMENNRRMREDYLRRRRMMEEEERRRKEREAEERRKAEEHRKMVEHRKSSPVVYNNEEWQQDRCIKAMSLQPCVQSLLSIIEEVRPTIIEEEQSILNRKIMEVGQRYEMVRKKIDQDIETLRNLGIAVSGRQYQLSRLVPTNTNMAIIEQINEFMGTTFTIADGQPIEINPRILDNPGYYQRRYEELHPEETARDFTETTKRMKRYQAIGKYLRFLLRTQKYLDLEDHSERITAEQEKCELRKKEMQSFQSLNKEQLLAIRSYFKHLGQLTDISPEIENLFRIRGLLKYPSNERVYDLTIKRVLANEENSEVLDQVRDYMTRLESNDEETMAEAYEMVKGEYPISINNRKILDLIITHMKGYKKEDTKKLKLS